MEKNGEFDAGSVDSVWKTVSDANEFSKLLPDVNYVDVNGDDFTIRFNVDVRKYTGKFLGASYMSALNVKFTGKIGDKEEKKHVKIEGKGSAVGMKFSVSLILDISESAGKAKVSWKADVETGGLAKLFGESVLEDAVNNTVEQIINTMEEKLGTGS